MGGRRALVAVTIGLVCLLVTGGFVWNRVRDHGSGPLFGADGSTSIGYFVHPQQPFTYALSTLVSTADHPAMVENVQLVSPTGGIRIVNSYLYPGTFRGAIPVNSRNFKPVPGLESLPGTVPPGAARLIVLELEVPGEGVFTTQGIKVDYSIGNTHYHAWFHDLLRACAPPPQGGEECRTQPVASH